MRRLFAETDDPLLHELRQGADVAGRLGIEVSFHPLGHYPQPPVEVRRALLESVLAVLTAARTKARVTVMGTTEMLSVSVVAGCTGVPRSRGAASALERSHTSRREGPEHLVDAVRRAADDRAAVPPSKAREGQGLFAVWGT